MDDNQVKAPASPGRIQPVEEEDVGHQPPKEYPTHPHKHVTSPVHEAARFVLWALFWAGISVELIAYFMYKGEWGDRMDHYRPQRFGLSDGSISGGEGGLPSFDMSSIKLPDISSLGLPDVSGLSLPSIDGLSLPDVSGLSLPDVSGLSLPDVSGLSIPDVSGLSMPEVKMPEGLPAMPETKATIPDLPPMPTMGF